MEGEVPVFSFAPGRTTVFLPITQLRPIATGRDLNTMPSAVWHCMTEFSPIYLRFIKVDKISNNMRTEKKKRTNKKIHIIADCDQIPIVNVKSVNA